MKKRLLLFIFIFANILSMFSCSGPCESAINRLIVHMWHSKKVFPAGKYQILARSDGKLLRQCSFEVVKSWIDDLSQPHYSFGPKAGNQCILLSKHMKDESIRGSFMWGYGFFGEEVPKEITFQIKRDKLLVFENTFETDFELSYSHCTNSNLETKVFAVKEGK